MRRLVVLPLLLGALLVPAAVTHGQGGGAFGPLPPAQQPTATPAPIETNSQDDVSRQTLLLIALGVAAVFVFIGMAITRDARSSLTDEDRLALERGGTAESSRQARNKAKAKARQKGKAQRQARKRARR